MTKIFNFALKIKGGGHSASAFYFVKLCVMINFSLHHNKYALLQFCTPCVAYNLYAIIKVVLLNV